MSGYSKAVYRRVRGEKDGARSTEASSPENGRRQKTKDRGLLKGLKKSPASRMETKEGRCKKRTVAKDQNGVGRNPSRTDCHLEVENSQIHRTEPSWSSGQPNGEYNLGRPKGAKNERKGCSKLEVSNRSARLPFNQRIKRKGDIP